MFKNEKPKAPESGYKLENWNHCGYRATAIAYLQRENVNEVENMNGFFYSLSELKAETLGFKD